MMKKNFFLNFFSLFLKNLLDKCYYAIIFLHLCFIGDKLDTYRDLGYLKPARTWLSILMIISEHLVAMEKVVTQFIYIHAILKALWFFNFLLWGFLFFYIVWGKRNGLLPSNHMGNYLFKVTNRKTRTRCEICSKLTIKATKRRDLYHLETSKKQRCQIIMMELSCKNS